ncbi:DUF5011 domain-containing protein, partial [Candidatus Poribacteria bacterium]|nr:DUF5011 domain-containing protein [Candidatus Poribacteria bacterium]
MKFSLSFVSPFSVTNTPDDDYVIIADALDADFNQSLPGIDVFFTLDQTAPLIVLTGANPQIIEIGVAYTELGATASDNDPNYVGVISIDATAVNTNLAGDYTVIYTANADAAGNPPIPVTRTVTIQDTIAPLIALTGANPQIIELGVSYPELGAPASDNDPNYV